MSTKPQAHQPAPAAARNCCAGLRWQGPLNRDALHDARERVRAAISQGCRTLIFDLAETEYVDSHGVRWLEELHRELQQRQGSLSLYVQSGSRVERTLRLLAVDDVLDITLTPKP